MKIGVLVLLLSTLPIFGAEPIKLQFNSSSLLFRPATLRVSPGVEHLHQAGFDSGSPNGELELAPENPDYTHWGYFFLRDAITFEVTVFDVRVPVPTADSNGNLIPDIFEYARSVAATTTFGEYFGP